MPPFFTTEDVCIGVKSFVPQKAKRSSMYKGWNALRDKERVVEDMLKVQKVPHVDFLDSHGKQEKGSKRHIKTIFCVLIGCKIWGLELPSRFMWHRGLLESSKLPRLGCFPQIEECTYTHVIRGTFLDRGEKFVQMLCGTWGIKISSKITNMSWLSNIDSVDGTSASTPFVRKLYICS